MTGNWTAGALVLTTLLAAGATATTPAATGEARFESVVARYLDRVGNPLTNYRAHRRLEASGLGRTGWLEAWTTMENGLMTYSVISEGGAESVRRRVLHKVLESERQSWASGAAQQSGITAHNYRFLRAEEQPGALVKVLLKPRRKGKLILDGAMFLDRAAELVRVEGRLTSNPSFWISRVDVTKRYESIGGYNLPVEIATVADIRFAGDATFRMSYRYTHVNGQPIRSVGTMAAAASR